MGTFPLSPLLCWNHKDWFLEVLSTCIYHWFQLDLWMLRTSEKSAVRLKIVCRRFKKKACALFSLLWCIKKKGKINIWEWSHTVLKSSSWFKMQQSICLATDVTMSIVLSLCSSSSLNTETILMSLSCYSKLPGQLALATYDIVSPSPAMVSHEKCIPTGQLNCLPL